MSTIPAIPMQLLKHTAFYIIDENGKSIFIQFKAETKMESFFKVPVASFKWPDGTFKTVSVTPFTGVLKFSNELPFNIEYRTGAWYANLRIRP